MAICKMSVLAVVVAAVAMVTMTSALPTSHVVSKRAVLLDENFAPIRLSSSVFRNTPRRRVVVKRAADDGFLLHTAEPKSYQHHIPGKVGPVYTFVKTDYHGNVKWGVRHRVGEQYGR